MLLQHKRRASKKAHGRAGQRLRHQSRRVAGQAQAGRNRCVARLKGPPDGLQHRPVGGGDSVEGPRVDAGARRHTTPGSLEHLGDEKRNPHSGLRNANSGGKSEREGFEPPRRLPADRISNAAPSATRTPLQNRLRSNVSHAAASIRNNVPVGGGRCNRRCHRSTSILS